MSFKDTVADDIHSVFLNTSEFAEFRSVDYDGVMYIDIPVVMRGIKTQDRSPRESDHAQGLYQATSVLHCALADLGGHQPEKGQRIKVNNAEGGGGFFQEFYVASSVCEMGMLQLGLEEIDE